MESLRGAADKIKKSPRLVRKKISNALHKEKLREDWIHNREQVELGVMFNLKVLGRKDTDEPQGKGCTDKVVEEFVQKNKTNSKSEKLQKVSVMIDCEKLIIRDLLTHQLVDDIPVKRICFCTADQTYPKVFAFMVLECEGSQPFVYAFLTNKKAMADAIALTVAQAYTMSYEGEQEQNLQKQEEVEEIMQQNAKDLYSDMDHGDDKQDGVNELEHKIESTKLSVPKITNIYNDVHSHLLDDEEDEFLMLAQSRKELDIGHLCIERFSSDITDFLAVNNTLGDLERAKSSEDLFRTDLQLMSPEFNSSPNGNLSIDVLSGKSSPTSPQQNANDLIQF